jgi:hypothetical protein
MTRGEVKRLLRRNDPAFWIQLKLLTKQATEFDDLIFSPRSATKQPRAALYGPEA